MPNQYKDTYSSLTELAEDLRGSEKKNTIIFAHNGVGKTSLSVAFKDVAKHSGESDTLYYNAFTEDLFYWDNDLDNDEERVLMFHRESHFFDGLDIAEMETGIRAILSRYSDFDFSIKLDIPKRKEDGTVQLVNYVTFRRMQYNEDAGATEWKGDIKNLTWRREYFQMVFFPDNSSDGH